MKVQRPNVLNDVAMDMHIIRKLSPALQKIFKTRTDLRAVTDDWGVGFVDELDYRREAENAEKFTKAIESTPLAGVVFAPTVVKEATTKHVLTTEWVVGERLEKSSAEDVDKLCSIAMNTYLTMLLDIGLLHCDPHPGNLMRTPDGKLCILDWGLVTQLDNDLQMRFIEHIAHLTSGDFSSVPEDLVALGFVPEDKIDQVMDSEIIDVLAGVYTEFASGGGVGKMAMAQVGKVDVANIVETMTDLTEKYGDIFRVPAYFVYIARSFAVLEGIGLSNNPDYGAPSDDVAYVCACVCVWSVCCSFTRACACA